MNTKILAILLLAASVITNLVFAQFTQQGPKLVGTGGIRSSSHGYSVAISGDGNTAIVGGPNDNDSAGGSVGAVWIFVRNGGVWNQQGPKLVGTGAGTYGPPQHGHSVAISSDGNTAIEGGWADQGGTGAVWVFTRNGNIWSQQGQKLVDTGVIGYQGYSVGISADGNTIVAGGPGTNSLGAIWIYTRSGGVWNRQGSRLVGGGSVGVSREGYSVAISADGNTVVAGGVGDNSQTGAVWIFVRNSGIWNQQGQKLVGGGSVGIPQQGYSVAISADGNTIIESGYGDNYQIGAAWVFTRMNGVWTQQGQKLVGTGAVGHADQGTSVALSSNGNTALIGGINDASAIGAVWVFIRSGGVWTQLGQKLVGTGSAGSSQQGSSVAITSDGNTVIEGGLADNGSLGATWVFVRSNYRFIKSNNNINKVIQGNQTTFDTISVISGDLSSYYVANVKVTIDTLNYPIDADLEISLIHVPNTDTLVYRVGGNGANFIGTILSDSASTPISNGTPPFTGNFIPNRPLAQFRNFDPSGAWIFKIYDRNTGQTGTLKAWTITLDLSPNVNSIRNISRRVPKGFQLEQNYPNPFNPTTNIRFRITDFEIVLLKIYDILGREIGTLVNKQMQPGVYEITWDATNYPSGVYFYKIQIGNFTKTKKMVLIK